MNTGGLYRGIFLTLQPEVLQAYMILLLHFTYCLEKAHLQFVSARVVWLGI